MGSDGAEVYCTQQWSSMMGRQCIITAACKTEDAVSTSRPPTPAPCSVQRLCVLAGCSREETPLNTSYAFARLAFRLTGLQVARTTSLPLTYHPAKLLSRSKMFSSKTLFPSTIRQFNQSLRLQQPTFNRSFHASTANMTIKCFFDLTWKGPLLVVDESGKIDQSKSDTTIAGTSPIANAISINALSSSLPASISHVDAIGTVQGLAGIVLLVESH